MEDIRESKDLVEKDFEAFPDVAADIINVLLYHGERIVAAETLLPAPTETVYQGTSGARNQFQDLAKYEMLDEMARVIYQFANQSGRDSKMIFRKAGYVGAVYREQYEKKMLQCCPVIELVLYWGEKPWQGARSIRRMFRRKKLPMEAWKYIDDLKLHVWEMRRLPPEVRELFISDMRIVVDYLAEGNSYRSDRPVKHKAALIKMIRVLSGDVNVEDTENILSNCNIREEDEITVCELFDQYWRQGKQEGVQQGIQQGVQQGIQQGIQILIATCKELNANFEVTAAKVKEKYQLSDLEVREKMRLYW